jgi:non-specific serine/threonine protein kinase
MPATPPKAPLRVAGMATDTEAAAALDESLANFSASELERRGVMSGGIDRPLTGAAAARRIEKPEQVLVCYGRYQVVRELGKGATGVVYLAYDPELHRNVAVKVISFSDSAQKTSKRLRRLYRGEITNARQLDHPNIVKIYDGEMEDDFAWFAMEYVDGVMLSQFTSFKTLLPPHRVVGIIFKAAMALDYAARRGIIHRDIKPDNIMLTSDDEVKITDFGLALDLKKTDAGDSTFIMGVGSPAYMSPEQIKDYPLNPQTDIYSLGVVLFELLTGRRPFRAKNYAQLVYKIVNMEPDRPSLLNPAIPEALDPVVKRALEKDLYSRYRSGAQFAQDIAGIKFQISADEVEKLNARFTALRQSATFVEFNNEEIWEVLRISVWRKVHEGYSIHVEGEAGESFGVLVAGEAEVSRGGRRLGMLKAGDLIGETAWLARKDKVRDLSLIATRDVIYLEINPAAFALASEECREHFEDLLRDALRKRLLAAYDDLGQHAPEARKGQNGDAGELQLVPLE